MSTLIAPTAEYVAAYGLKRPGLDDARQAVERVYAEDAPRMWAELTSGLAVGGADESAALDRVVAAMRAHADGVVRLCGQSLSIRIGSYARLSATHAIVSL